MNREPNFISSKQKIQIYPIKKRKNPSNNNQMWNESIKSFREKPQQKKTRK